MPGLNKIVFTISNRKTKTSELLLIKYIKIMKIFMIESHHQVCTKRRFGPSKNLGTIC